MAALGLAAVAVPLLAAHDADAGSVGARAVGVALPVSFGLFRLARDPRDRFAPFLLAAGVLWSLTTLSESSASVPYSIGRLSVWLCEPLLIFLVLSFPFGR